MRGRDIMAKSENQKLKTLYIMDYLLENTNKDITVKREDIEDYLSKRCDISVERRTIYTDIKLLEKYGIKRGITVKYDYVKKGYKIEKRDFDINELQLLIDSVQSCKFITEKKAAELTNKLKKLASCHDRETLNYRSYVTNRIRNMNDSELKHLNKIHYCIAKKQKLSFCYFSYNIRKEKIHNKKLYIVSPYALLWDNNNYYLIANDGGKEVKHFRVDKMDNINIADEPREENDEYSPRNLSERATKVFSMYGGEEERITLRCINRMAGVIIDTFGANDINMIPDGKSHFFVRVGVAVSPQFFAWLCGLGKTVKIVSPDSVVKKMAEYVAGIAKMYETDEKI